MARYDQCDQTCTTDCGHCKGQSIPGENLDLSTRITNDLATDPKED